MAGISIACFTWKPGMESENKDYNVNVIRSVWRRLNKGHIEIRDLDPRKDVKGGAGVTRRFQTPSQAVTGNPSHESSH
jgi:hypothetical protein